MQLIDSKSTFNFNTQVAVEFVSQLGEEATHEEVACICPYCDGPSNDKSKKTLSVNILKCKFFCFHCHKSGGPIDMVHGINSGGGALFKKIEKRQFLSNKKIEFAPITVKVKSLPISIKNQVINDLIHRKVFNESHINEFDYCLSGSRPKKWINRVLIKTDGVSFGKAIQISGKEKIIPKYMTEPNFKLTENGYIGINELKLDTNDPAILAEGLLDYYSLPKHHRLMSPGTSGLFNDLLRTTSSKRQILTVPDSDLAGIKAFLSILNKGILSDPSAKVKFCFVYWITNHDKDDINDLHVKMGGNQYHTYEELVNASLDAASTLKKLQKKYKIVKSYKGWSLKEEDSNAKKNITRKDIRRTIISRTRERRNSKLSWF